MSKINQLIKLLLSDTGFVFIASTMASGFSFLASLLMARILNSNEYGIYGSCITLFNYTLILGNTIQASTTRTTAQLQARSGIEAVKHFQRPAFFSLTRIGFLLFLPLAALSLPIAGFLQINVWQVIIVFSCAVLFGPLFMTTGTLQGLQSFKLFSVSLNVLAIGRLLASVVLALIGLQVWGAIIALPFAMLVNIALNVFLVEWVIKRHESQSANRLTPLDTTQTVQEKAMLSHPLRTFFTTSFFALFGMVSFAVLTSIDIILVRHFFPDDTAGHYAVVSFLGKAVLYFSAPIALVALPKMAHAYERGENISLVFRRNLWLTVGLCLIPVAVLYLLSSFILKLFALDHASSELNLLLPLYGLVMLLYSVVTLWIYFFISVNRNRYMFMVLAGAILEVILLFNFHDTLTEIVLMLGLPAILLWIAGEVEFWLYNRTKGQLPTLHEASPALEAVSLGSEIPK